MRQQPQHLQSPKHLSTQSIRALSAKHSLTPIVTAPRGNPCREEDPCTYIWDRIQSVSDCIALRFQTGTVELQEHWHGQTFACLT